MNAMILPAQGSPLRLSEIEKPKPGKGQVLVKVRACGICRTDLHVVDGDLKHPKLPLVPGHQVVGTVEALGAGVKDFKIGDRVGIPWLGGSCGSCGYCKSGRENLCDKAVYTGYQVNGGFAEYAAADARFIFPIPNGFPDLQAAPLLCAGLIGWRAYKMAGAGKRLGFYGFGAAAHLLTQVAKHQGREVYAFTRAGDEASQAFARKLGTVWAGASEAAPPVSLDAAILFAPAGDLVPTALRAVAKGGTVVCAGIHMSDIPSFPYEILWGERTVRSVANLTRKDGEEFLKLAPKIPIHSEVKVYPLEKANEALSDLREGKFQGAAVLKISTD
jgi:alcohol dehydrogenase, propanol-preferring